MVDLYRLTRTQGVSLTKFGAYKTAEILTESGAENFFAALAANDAFTLDRAQARKILCASKRLEVPKYWNDAISAGELVLNGLILFSLICSHSALVRAFRDGASADFRGTITYTSGDRKPFTNLRRAVIDLGYGTEDSDSFAYDFTQLFASQVAGTIASQILFDKFTFYGWDQSTSLEEEVSRNNLGLVFATTNETLCSWLVSAEGEVDTAALVADEPGAASSPRREFLFQPGHRARKEGSVPVKASLEDTSASLLHNELQTNLYKELCGIHGADNVGTEIPTGSSTSIDAVVSTPSGYIFYEIKTGGSMRLSIREALPQLLEYAYWHETPPQVSKLIIAAPAEVTSDGEVYLERLREKHALPVTYEQLSLPKSDS